MKNHILVTGPHRSGTTWVGKTIDRHRDVQLVHEPFNPDFEGYNFDYRFRHWFEHVPGSPDRPAIERVFDRYLPQTRFQYPAKICRETGYNWKSPLLYFKYLFNYSSMPHYLLKDPIALYSAGWLYERYDLKVICITRNPLAFAGSLKKQKWDFDFGNLLNQHGLVNGVLAPYRDEMVRVQNDGDFIDRISLLWVVLNKAILEYTRNYPEWHFITHEELALKPAAGFQAMFQYLGLELTEGIREYIRRYTSAKNPDEAASHKFQPRSSRDVLRTWKKRLTDDEVHRITSCTEEIYHSVYEAIDPDFRWETIPGVANRLDGE